MDRRGLLLPATRERKYDYLILDRWGLDGWTKYYGLVCSNNGSLVSHQWSRGLATFSIQWLRDYRRQYHRWTEKHTANANNRYECFQAWMCLWDN
ncbi:hypothetical protein N7460_008206 [Penicillium canescens]|uniref:Uncharacterized protein n=1 Tax=Penicillium canescens TaxID=5083 RepID=A0AAD6N793_PENCN|nr:hypothetical protein N7460_008206 [Penicillium canescens]